MTAIANETYAWLQSRAPWYRPSRGDLCLVAWWAEIQRAQTVVLPRGGR